MWIADVRSRKVPLGVLITAAQPNSGRQICQRILAKDEDHCWEAPVNEFVEGFTAYIEARNRIILEARENNLRT